MIITDEFEDIEEDDEEMYGGIRGLFYHVKDLCEDIYEVNGFDTKYAKLKGALNTVKKRGAQVAWVFSTTMVLIALPLLLEVQREQQFMEQQAQQVQILKSQGYSMNQIKQMGFKV